MEIRNDTEKIIEYYEQNFNKVKLKSVFKLPKDIFKIFKVE